MGLIWRSNYTGHLLLVLRVRHPDLFQTIYQSLILGNGLRIADCGGRTTIVCRVKDFTLCEFYMSNMYALRNLFILLPQANDF